MDVGNALRHLGWYAHRIISVVVLLVLGGCHVTPKSHEQVAGPVVPISHDIPRELRKVSLPPYVIEPPDILVVEALNVIPKAPYQLGVADVLAVQVEGTLPDAPVQGAYSIEPGGIVNLGYPYGPVRVLGLTTDEAKATIEEHLRQFLREPIVIVSLLQMMGQQQIAGEHLVTPDGTISLGSYGSVRIVGLTIPQAKVAIEQHLSQFLEDPEVSVDVFAYNSKVYYVITEGAGLGDTVTRFPVTGNETVLDAISNVNGLSSISSKRIWISRPSPHSGDVQILPVDWKAVTGHASTTTNYQVLPGDRVFVAENQLVAFDNGLGKLLAPFERIMGFSLLGLGTVSRFSGRPLQRGGFGGGIGGF
jgi:polysaccharide export outer membrane protein